MQDEDGPREDPPAEVEASEAAAGPAAATAAAGVEVSAGEGAAVEADLMPLSEGPHAGETAGDDARARAVRRGVAVVALGLAGLLLVLIWRRLGRRRD